MTALTALPTATGINDLDWLIVNPQVDMPDVLPFLRAGVELNNGARVFIAPAYANGEVGAVLGVEFSLGKD